MEWKYCYECKHSKRKYNQKPCNTCMENGISNWEQGKTDEKMKKIY